MNLKNILSEIEKTEPEVFEQISDRRGALKSFGAKVAVAALPLAIGSMFKKAYGKTTDINSALNFALELEYIEYNFFHTANNVTGLGLIPAVDQPGFQMIEAQEKAHVNFLISTITAMGGTPFVPNHYTDHNSVPPYVPNAYDFTASANTTYHPVFGNVFNDYPTFLIAAQVLEDCVVRAYNGQLQNLIGNSLFTQLQQLQATEGRHAAYVRLLRRNMGAPEIPAPWITNNIPPTSTVAGAVNVLQPFYVGEDNTQQLNVIITSLPDGSSTVPADSATAAFDEPLDQTTVMSLLSPFILL